MRGTSQAHASAERLRSPRLPLVYSTHGMFSTQTQGYRPLLPPHSLPFWIRWGPLTGVRAIAAPYLEPFALTEHSSADVTNRNTPSLIGATQIVFPSPTSDLI